MQQNKKNFSKHAQVQSKSSFIKTGWMSAGKFILYVLILLIILADSKISFAQITRDTGEIFIEISNIIAAMPGNSGDHYQPPSTAELTTWGTGLSLLLNGNYDQADLVMAAIGYEVVEFKDTSAAVNSTYWLLRSTGSNYWGTYVYNPNYCRALVIQSPHAKNEFNTGKQGIHVFIKTQALFFCLCGTNRCNNAAFSACSGTTAVCSDLQESHRISDLPHNISTVFQSTTDTLSKKFPSSYFIQFHGFTMLDTDPYVIISNGTQITPDPDYIVPLCENLYNEDNSLTFKIAHVDLDWGRLRSFNNTQGRLINASQDACSLDATTTNGRFIHIEQEKVKLRDNQAAWDKMANALINTFTCYNMVWNGSSSEFWDDPANWREKKMPTPTDNISIAKGDNVLFINEPAEMPAKCGHVEIQNGASVTINAGKAFTVDGDLHNYGSLTLLSTEAATASLIVDGAVRGNANIERYIGGYDDARHGWHLLSSPVISQEISAFHTLGPGNDFLKWDEAHDKWVNRTASDGSLNIDFETAFIPGTGYLMANMVSSTKCFSGVPNNADLTISGLSFTDASSHTGWHLLGNPYPSALFWNRSEWNLTNIDAMAKLWQESSASYVDILSCKGVIPAMQGFMVHVNAPEGSLTIDASDRTHNDLNWYKDQDFNVLKLTVYDIEGGTSQETIIKIVDSATADFDHEFDSYFLAGYAPKFYSRLAGADLSTNALPEISAQTIIPLSFIKNAGSAFIIQAEGISTFADPLPVYLTDLNQDYTQLLNENPVYAFTSAASDIPERFILHFSPPANKPLQQIKISGNGNTILIHSNKPIAGTIDVYNLAGQLIKSKKISNSNGTTLILPDYRGAVIVSVVTSKAVINKKVLLWE